MRIRPLQRSLGGVSASSLGRVHPGQTPPLLAPPCPLHAGIHPPPVDRQTDSCKNITVAGDNSDTTNLTRKPYLTIIACNETEIKKRFMKCPFPSISDPHLTNRLVSVIRCLV